jgi:hypothetical protein
MWIINMLGPLAQGRGVVIKTRTGVRSFGAGLSADDTRYVHAVVRAALLGRNAT